MASPCASRISRTCWSTSRRLLEFHFTDQDLDEHYPGNDFDLQLVVHAPEFWDRTLVDLCTTDSRQRLDSIALIQKSIDLAREMAPHFKGKPKVIVHPGAMSLDHPLGDLRTLYDNLRLSIAAIDHAGGRIAAREPAAAPVVLRRAVG